VGARRGGYGRGLGAQPAKSESNATRRGPSRSSPRAKCVISGLGLLEAGVTGAATENERGQRDDRSNQTTHVSLPLVLVSAL
jgi:hypothetical protein